MMPFCEDHAYWHETKPVLKCSVASCQNRSVIMMNLLTPNPPAFKAGEPGYVKTPGSIVDSSTRQ